MRRLNMGLTRRLFEAPSPEAFLRQSYPAEPNNGRVDHRGVDTCVCQRCVRRNQSMWTQLMMGRKYVIYGVIVTPFENPSHSVLLLQCRSVIVGGQEGLTPLASLSGQTFLGPRHQTERQASRGPLLMSIRRDQYCKSWQSHRKF